MNPIIVILLMVCSLNLNNLFAIIRSVGLPPSILAGLSRGGIRRPLCINGILRRNSERI